MQYSDKSASMFDVAEHRRFGHFETDLIGIDSGVIKAFDYEFQEAGIAQSLSGQIYRDTTVRW